MKFLGMTTMTAALVLPALFLALLSFDWFESFHQKIKIVPICSAMTLLGSARVDNLDSTALTPHLRDFDDDIAGMPHPASGLDRAKRAATFWYNAVPIIAGYYSVHWNIRMRELMGTITTSNKLTDDQIQDLWDAQHAKGAAKLVETIENLKGFYVKTAQVVSSRRDLFPPQYTDALSVFTHFVDPMPPALVRTVVEKELRDCHQVSFDDVFIEFDDEPVGAASVAQVHRAVLTSKYGNREVAVKIQRPAIRAKVTADIANLKVFAKALQNSLILPLYAVFQEIEKGLNKEFDFISEARAMDRIYYDMLRASHFGHPRDLPVVLPRPYKQLVSKRVLVMDYLHGVPLSRAREQMLKRGIDPDSPEVKIFGRRLLTALTEMFSQTVLETGFFHADPHPGNLFLMNDGQVGLVDFGFFHQLSPEFREKLCHVVLAVANRKDNSADDIEKIGQSVLDLGVVLKDDARKEAAGAIGIFLLDNTVEKLPGGYDLNELGPDSPLREVRAFPDEIVLVARTIILLKGISNRFGIPWNLAHLLVPTASRVLSKEKCNDNTVTVRTGRFRVLWRLWRVSRSIGRRCKMFANNVVVRLPGPIRRRVAAAAFRQSERRASRAMSYELL